MVWVRKVGILKYTGEYGSYELRIRTRSGTICWKVDGDEFVNGWYKVENDNRGRPRKMRADGYIHEWQRIHARPMPMEVVEAIRGYEICPSVLDRIGRKIGNGVEWLPRRKDKGR